MFNLKTKQMELQNNNELNAQELELLNSFQMEELEERFEMEEEGRVRWFAGPGGNQGPGTVTGGNTGIEF